MSQSTARLSQDPAGLGIGHMQNTNMHRQKFNGIFFFILFQTATVTVSVASPPDIASLAPDPSELASSTDLTSVYDVIYRVSQAHRTNCIYTEEVIQTLLISEKKRDKYMKSGFSQTLLLRKPIQLPSDPVSDEECEVSVQNKTSFLLCLPSHSASFR